MLPAFKNPRINWIIPAINPAVKKISKYFKSVIAVKTMAVKPAAGPETLICDRLMVPTTIPPTTPAIIPESGGAPEANAIPKHSGRATKKTTKPDGKSDLRLAKIFTFFVIIPEKFNTNCSPQQECRS